MRLGIPVLGVLLLLVAGPAQAQPLFSQTQDPIAGSRVFGASGCVKCHSVNGVGGECHSAGGQGGSLGPDLAERSISLSQMQFASSMWNKTPAMLDAMRSRAMPVPQIQPDEVADIVAYLYSVRYFAAGGDAKRGAAVASAEGCLKDPRPERQRTPWPELKAGEMADRVAFLQGLRRTP